MQSTTARLRGSVRAPLRDLAVWYERRRPAAPLEDWSTPLVSLRPGGPGPARSAHRGR